MYRLMYVFSLRVVVLICSLLLICLYGIFLVSFLASLFQDAWEHENWQRFAILLISPVHLIVTCMRCCRIQRTFSCLCHEAGMQVLGANIHLKIYCGPRNHALHASWSTLSLVVPRSMCLVGRRRCASTVVSGKRIPIFSCNVSQRCPIIVICRKHITKISTLMTILIIANGQSNLT